MEQHGGADPDRIAVDGGDDWRFVVGQRPQQPPDRDVRRSRRRQFSEEVSQVVASGEVLAAAFQGDDADFGVVGHALDRIGQFGIHCDGDRVAPIGPVHDDPEDAAAARHLDMLAHRPPFLESARPAIAVETAPAKGIAK